MHTEAEAKTKWCPFARVVQAQSDVGATYPRNRVVEQNKDGEVRQDWGGKIIGAQCVGSDCMAWRWVKPNAEGTGPLPQAAARGLCGLAVKS